MEIGIIGTGNIGSVLTRYLTKLGHEVSIANSRGPSTLTDLAAETGARAVTAAEAAGAKDLVIITVPASAIVKLPREILSKSGAIVVDTGNYFPSRDGAIPDIDAGMIDSEWVSRTIGHDVVKAFNNIITKSLATKAVPAGHDGRIAISVSGNDPEERRVVAALIDAIGFDTVDNGPLSESWRHQPGSPAYCNDLDTEALAKAHAQAVREEVPTYRAAANEDVRRYYAALRATS